jgi:hypothetical protein
MHIIRSIGLQGGTDGTDSSLCIHVYMCICISVYVYMYVYVYIHIFVQVCMYIYICIYMHVYIQIHIYVYTEDPSAKDKVNLKASFHFAPIFSANLSLLNTHIFQHTNLYGYTYICDKYQSNLHGYSLIHIYVYIYIYI